MDKYSAPLYLIKDFMNPAELLMLISMTQQPYSEICHPFHASLGIAGAHPHELAHAY